MADRERRVRPPADLEKEVLDKLAGTSATSKLFPTKAKAVLFAGVLGYHLGKKEDVGAFGEGIRLEYFEEEVKILDMVAIADTGDLRVIADDTKKDVIEIFEKYVNGGLKHIRETCFTGARTPMDGMLMLLSAPASDADVLPGLI